MIKPFYMEYCDLFDANNDKLLHDKIILKNNSYICNPIYKPVRF
jgi:hypothetical protein